MVKNKFDLKGKTALITGSSQGIGKSIALVFAEFGANIIVHYRSDRADAVEVARQVSTFGVDVQIVKADFSKANAAKNLFNKLSTGVDIVVINASVQLPVDWQKITDKQINEQYHTNFTSTLQLMQQFIPPMISSGWGRVLTIGSVQQAKPHPLMAVYAATKSASLNLVQNIAMQLAESGVTINNLAPGVIETPRIKEKLPSVNEKILHRMDTPMGRTGMPDECASVALLLCSEAGSYITGQNIFVDGGMSL